MPSEPTGNGLKQSGTRRSSNMDAKKGDNKEPTTQIIQGSDKVVDRLLQLMQKAQRINICVDNTRPLLAVQFKQIREAFTDAKMRGVF